MVLSHKSANLAGVSVLKNCFADCSFPFLPIIGPGALVCFFLVCVSVGVLEEGEWEVGGEQ